MVAKNVFHIGILLGMLASCVTPAPDPDSPSESYEYARQLYEDANYDMAIKRLGEFKSRFPYNKFAKEAELLIAHSHFALGRYAEASVAYESFVRFHPKHPEVPLALYRTGLSYWEDAPESIDREQEFTGIAIEKWQRLVVEFPDSPHTSEAVEKIKEGRRRIAESEQFIAGFYCRKELWQACAFKNEKILERYRNYTDIFKEALRKGSIAFKKLAEQYEPDSDENIYYKKMNKDDLLKRSRQLEDALRNN